MAFSPIPFGPQWSNEKNSQLFSGAVLKAYEPGTTTNISMYINDAGDSPQATIALNAFGVPEVSGNEVIPHIDRKYKLALYPDQASADADTGAVWGPIDNLPVYLPQGSVLITESTTETMVANARLLLGDMVVTKGRVTSNDGGSASYLIVSGGTGSDDGGRFINLDNGLQAALVNEPRVNLAVYGTGQADDNAEIASALLANPVSVMLESSKSYPLGGVPISYPDPLGIDDSVRIEGNRGELTQTGQQVEILRLTSVSDTERFTDTGLHNVRFIQEKQSPFVSNNHACFKVIAGDRPYFIGNTGDVDIVCSYVYGYTPDGASATRSTEFGVIALNSFSFKTLGIEFLSANYCSIVGNVMRGDSGAFQHCFRVSGYAGAQVNSNAYAGNVAYQGAHGYSIQKTAKYNAIGAFTVNGTSGDAIEFTDINGEPGTVAQNLPEGNFIGCGTVVGGPKAVNLSGAERNIIDIIAVDQTGIAIETSPESGGGTGNENTIRGIVQNAGDRGLNITTDYNRLDVSVYEPSGIGVNVSGDSNIGSVAVHDGASSGLFVSGDNNNIEALVRNCIGTELTMNGSSNRVTGHISGDITFNGTDNVFDGICTGTITENGSRNSVIRTHVTNTTALDDATSSVNTQGKFTGVRAYNTTTKKTLSAGGSSANSPWRDSSGLTEHTPV